MISENGNIIITSIGRRVELLNYFVYELKKFNKNLIVFTADSNPDLSAASNISKHSFKLPHSRSSNFIEKLLKVSIKNRISLIIPTIDTELEVLAKNRGKFLKNNIQIICSDYKLIKKLRDKRNIPALAKEFNVDTPKIYSIKNLKYPCFSKPYDGSNSKNIQVIKNTIEMKLAKKNNRIFFSQFLDSDFQEFTIDAYYNKKSELICSVPRQRLAVRGGEIEKGITRKGRIYKYFKNRFSNFSGLIGPITFQFMANVKKNKFYLIEINPRFGGGYPLSYHAGSNYPKYIIQEYLSNKHLKKFDKWEKNLLSLRYDKDVVIRQ